MEFMISIDLKGEMMKKFYIAVMAIMLLALPLAAEGLKTYTNGEYGFSLEYSEVWENQLDLGPLLTLTILDEDMPVVFSAIAESLAVEDQQGDLDLSVDEAIEMIQAQLEDIGLASIEVLESGYTTQNEIPALHLNLKISILDLIYMKMDNVIVKNGGNLIFLSYLAEESVYDKHAPDYAAIKSSFRLAK